jgi:hypothetical protein
MKNGNVGAHAQLTDRTSEVRPLVVALARLNSALVSFGNCSHGRSQSHSVMSHHRRR